MGSSPPSLVRLRALTLPSAAVGGSPGGLKLLSGPPDGPEGPGIPPAAGQRCPRPPGPRTRAACAPSHGAGSAHPGRRGRASAAGAVRAAAESPVLSWGCRHVGPAGHGLCTAAAAPGVKCG